MYSVTLQLFARSAEQTDRMKRFGARYLVAALACLSAIGTAVFVGERTGFSVPKLWSSHHTEEVRRFYPYSVIPGGVQSGAELKRALERDGVARNHYQGFAVDRVRQQVLREDRNVFVSYRIGNQVFWTRKRVLLKKGEAILTDGIFQARVRCGNRIADMPRGELSLLEPDQQTLDTWFDTQPGVLTWKTEQLDTERSPQSVPGSGKADFRPELQPAVVTGQMSGSDKDYGRASGGGFSGSGGGGGGSGGGSGGRSAHSTSGTNAITIGETLAGTVGTIVGGMTGPIPGNFYLASSGSGLLPVPRTIIGPGESAANSLTVAGANGTVLLPPMEWPLFGPRQAGSLVYQDWGPVLTGSQITLGAAVPLIPNILPGTNSFFDSGWSGGNASGNLLRKEVQTPEPSTCLLGLLGTFSLIAGFWVRRARVRAGS